MYYTAKIIQENNNFLIEFPDCPGCQTFTEDKDKIQFIGQEALEGWLEANLDDPNWIPPKPIFTENNDKAFFPSDQIIKLIIQRWEEKINLVLYCNFCVCYSCIFGEYDHSSMQRHAQTEEGFWICHTCYTYDVCTDKRPNNGPCEKRECEHRPKLVEEFHP